ncbi:amidohydrolase family protein [Sphingosinicella sp. BN140058]|uniref:metal-dependent hydrolase family protein n=1 Tax=Sphingosinicella sp. BN140058 TaxID=1892855 RepID=UPI0010107A94|nr:amidohydrolase family protein [Sphingosinicella sp. BN140058]QAY75526.1 amidohydrolase family protein [Sphingosinicella sp. BN140058]
MRLALAGLLIASGSSALAVQPSAVTHSEGRSTVIHAGHLLDRPGRAVRGPSTIIVRDGRISEIIDGLAPPPVGARLIDLSAAYVLPGLIDTHVHLETDAGGVAALVEDVSDNAPAKTLRALANARKTIKAGFTTVRNLGDGSGATLAIRDAAARGELVSPRIVDAGRAISTTSGHMDSTLSLAEDLHAGIIQDNLCDGADACRRAVRLQVRRGADVIKIATTGGVNSRIGAGLGAQMFDDEAKAIADTARLYGKKVAVHAHGADGINLALAAGAASIEHGTMLDDESVRLFKRSGAYLVPTLSTVNGYLERLAADPNAYSAEVMPKIRWRIGITGKNVEKAYPAGVKIAFGTDAGVSRHGSNADEFELLVKHGLPPAEAIKAATVNAADLLDLSAEIGTLEPGKRADVIAVAGDPLQDVTVLKRVAFVMKDGMVVKD